MRFLHYLRRTSQRNRFKRVEYPTCPSLTVNAAWMLLLSSTCLYRDFIKSTWKYLDENKKLILAILDNQNLGKLAECAQYQAQLQKNLMYLAAIADAQPQAVTMPPQMPPQLAMQQGMHYMQHPQGAAAQQPGVFVPKAPLQFNPQQMQQHQLHNQHQQATLGHIGMRPGASNGIHAMHNEATLGGSIGPPSTMGLTEFTHGGGGGASSGLDVGGGSKRDVSEASSGDRQGNTAAGHGGADGESSYLKGSEDGN